MQGPRKGSLVANPVHGKGSECAGRAGERDRFPSIIWGASDRKEIRQLQVHMAVDSNPGCTRETPEELLDFKMSRSHTVYLRIPGGRAQA